MNKENQPGNHLPCRQTSVAKYIILVVFHTNQFKLRKAFPCRYYKNLSVFCNSHTHELSNHLKSNQFGSEEMFGLFHH